MIRTLLRTLLIIVIVVGLASFFVGYRWAGRTTAEPVAERPVGTAGAIDTSDAREAGAKVGEKVAVGVNEAQRATANAALTAKIKSKMALDDVVDAAAIDVDTTNGVVTLTGRVSSAEERTRAVTLARQTEGVRNVVDNLSVGR